MFMLEMATVDIRRLYLKASEVLPASRQYFFFQNLLLEKQIEVEMVAHELQRDCLIFKKRRTKCCHTITTLDFIFYETLLVMHN